MVEIKAFRSNVSFPFVEITSQCIALEGLLAKIGALRKSTQMYRKGNDQFKCNCKMTHYSFLIKTLWINGLPKSKTKLSKTKIASFDNLSSHEPFPCLSRCPRVFL